MSTLFTIPFDHAGLDPRVASVLDDIVTTIQTWANKSVIAAGSSGSFVQPRCRYYLSADQTLITATDTSLLWTGPATATDSVATNTLFDNGTTFGALAFVPTTSTADLIAPMAGQYLVSAGAVFAASAAGRRDLWLEQRIAMGAYFEVARVNMPTNIAGNGTALQVSHVLTLQGGESVRVRASQNSGGNLNLTAGFASTWVQMIKLS